MRQEFTNRTKRLIYDRSGGLCECRSPETECGTKKGNSKHTEKREAHDNKRKNGDAD